MDLFIDAYMQVIRFWVVSHIEEMPLNFLKYDIMIMLLSILNLFRWRREGHKRVMRIGALLGFFGNGSDDHKLLGADHN
jgi:hypothetical protein